MYTNIPSDSRVMTFMTAWDTVDLMISMFEFVSSTGPGESTKTIPVYLFKGLEPPEYDLKFHPSLGHKKA